MVQQWKVSLPVSLTHLATVWGSHFRDSKSAAHHSTLFLKVQEAWKMQGALTNWKDAGVVNWSLVQVRLTITTSGIDKLSK